jgi:hypothetical protein
MDNWLLRQQPVVFLRHGDDSLVNQVLALDFGEASMYKL